MHLKDAFYRSVSKTLTYYYRTFFLVGSLN